MSHSADESEPGVRQIRAIAWHRGPFKQKLGIPRQAGIHKEISVVELDRSQVGPACVDGLEAVSHLWITFGFSAHDSSKASDSVRPPRLGGRARLGVFATRSPYRHNGLGLSLVEVCSVDFPEIRVRGADLLDGTPIYDIKPYLPWSEAPEGARCDWAPAPPQPVELRFSPEAEAQLRGRADQDEVRQLLRNCLVVDPRPAYDREASEREFRTRIGPVDVSFRVEGQDLYVTQLK